MNFACPCLVKQGYLHLLAYVPAISLFIMKTGLEEIRVARFDIFITAAAIILAILGGVLYLLGSTIYYANVIYFRYGGLFPLVVGLLFVILLVKSYRKPSENRGVACFTLVLALAAVIGSAATMLPQFLFDFEPLDSVEMNNQTYHAGLRMALDGDNYVWLYECDGIFCEIREKSCYLSLSDTQKSVELKADEASQTLSLWVDKQEDCVFLE